MSLVEASLGATDRHRAEALVEGNASGSPAWLAIWKRLAGSLFGLVDVPSEQSSPRQQTSRPDAPRANPVSAASRIITSRYLSASTRSPRQVAALTKVACGAQAEGPVAEALGDFAQLVGVGGPFVECRRRPDRERAPLQDLPEREVVVDATGHDERLIAERSGSVGVTRG